MLPRRSVPGSLVSLRGFVIKAIGDATMGTANRTWSPAAIVSVSWWIQEGVGELRLIGKSAWLSVFDKNLSGDDRDRTGNLLVANQALSQLSYVPGVGGRRSGDRLGSQNVNFMIATAGWFG